MLYMVQSGYQPDTLLERTSQYQQMTGHKVHLHFVEYKDLWEQVLRGVEEGLYDVVLTDVIWTHHLVETGAILPLPPGLARKVRTNMVSHIVKTFELDGDLWVFPFFMDFQLLYTNRRILGEAGYSAPPGSLEELVAMARSMKRQNLIPYPLFIPLAREEVIVCELLMWAGAFGGGLSPLGGGRAPVRVNSPEAVKALGWLQGLLEEGLLNPYSLEADEVMASQVFLAQDCAFTVNWVFLLGKIQDNLIMSSQSVPSPVPQNLQRGDDDWSRSGSSVNGFQGFSVLASSSHPDLSWDFISYLSEIDFHKQNPQELPPWKSIWDDPPPDNPYFTLKISQIPGLRDRPYHHRYMEISEILQEWTHRILSEGLDPRWGLDQAQKAIQRILEP